MKVLGNIVENFGKISAAKVNWAKSESLTVRSWSVGLPQLPLLSWRRGGLKYLGVHLGDQQNIKKNWEGVVEKVEGDWPSGSGCYLTCHTEEES